MSNKEQEELGKYFNLLLKLGIGICSSILIGFALGFFLEKQFGSNGFFLLLGIGLGIVVGFMLLFREIKQLDRLTDDQPSEH